MTPKALTRREASIRFLGLLSVIGLMDQAKALPEGALPPDDESISRTCECIHQEVLIKANPARVYQALTDAKQFSKVTDIVMPGAATTISPDAGGAFSLFGGVITGRNIEMVQGGCLVQAWRQKSWEPGVYSLVKFQLNEQGADTKLVFDQTAIPRGQAGHLAPGWRSHYWEPLQKYLA
ncbi:MAG TPA: SRPBCC domain-containing protein [Terriglobales bacterium]